MAETFDTPDPLTELDEPELRQLPDGETAQPEIDIEALAEIRLDRARGLSFDEGA
jgi:hypothetical protein